MSLNPETLAELKKLGELRDSGIINQEEFDVEKSRLMNPSVIQEAVSSDTTSGVDIPVVNNGDGFHESKNSFDSGLSNFRRHLDHGLADMSSMNIWKKMSFRMTSSSLNLFQPVIKNALKQIEEKGLKKFLFLCVRTFVLAFIVVGLLAYLLGALLA